jgi:glutamine synthetase
MAAQAVVPAMQCQVGVKAAAARARPAAAGGRLWGVRSRTGRGGASGFKVMAVSTGVVPRLEQLLNMDTTPYTDKIIAEYIWY